MKAKLTRGIAAAVVKYALVSVLLLSVARFMLLLFNPSLFAPLGFRMFNTVLWGGMLFDFSTFCLVHLLAIPFLFIPIRVLQKKILKIVLKSWLIVLNIALLAPSIIDVIYFRFTLKRTTADIFNLMGAMKDEMGGLTGQFLADFWYMLLIFLALIAILLFALQKTIFLKKLSLIQIKYWKQLVFGLIFVALLVTGGRGSFRIRPLSILHATRIAGPEYAALVVNSTFTIIKTYGKEDLEKKSYFSKDEVEYIFSPIHYYNVSNEPVKKTNVVIIIVESLSAEHMGCLNNGLQSFTPFLDSLSRSSMLFSNMFANGKKSLEGIPAVISSIPPIMQNPFVTSMYSGNNIAGVASMLKKYGYSSAFFHGGFNGTMNFDGFAGAAGYNKYFGKNEYDGSESDFDGRWGIFDEPFLQFLIRKTNEFKEPFTTCVFTLSSHHPYTIPKQHQGRFPKGPKEIDETIAYADFALRHFFETVSHTSWYKNTLFIITADHTSELYSDCFARYPNNYAIPMIWFNPSDSNLVGRNEIICQQTDILPSIADYLNLNDTIYSFGNSVFDLSARRFAVMQTNLIYQMVIRGNIFIEFDGEMQHSQKEYFDCRNNTQAAIGIENEESNFDLLKAIIQQFNNRTIDNRLTKK
ncbi:MAG: hypothetical protein CVU11_11840 [Bacteroidetes bacterium HGW-Bacteroidetes-6]|jgi:phosphoglycerol transferase MdoB-like AlkP superfamily enzyme|nr:MAG: hypothetical protein CVU11_11840 [Bacteroidetes bacterium HGW-Bacteroidetes-6]